MRAYTDSLCNAACLHNAIAGNIAPLLAFCTWNGLQHKVLHGHIPCSLLLIEMPFDSVQSDKHQYFVRLLLYTILVGHSHCEDHVHQRVQQESDKRDSILYLQLTSATHTVGTGRCSKRKLHKVHAM